MTRAILRIFVAVFILVSSQAAPAFAAEPSASLFKTEATAQQHCPKDTVVWLNTKSGVYYFKGQRWYGATKQPARTHERV